MYFLSDTVAGEITTTAPSIADHVLVKVGIPKSSTQLIVNPEIKAIRK